jgi:PST family polysaccharide transporter
MIVLARLLLPEDFGVVAMADTFTIFVSWLIDLGLTEAIVQRKEVTNRHLSTIFWSGWALGIFLCLVLVAASPLASYFFRNDLVRPVLMVSSVTLAIRPLGAVHGALLRKKLDFFRFAIAEVGTAAAYLVAALAMAFAGLGLWSIVLGLVFSEISSVAIRWVLYHWKPSFVFGRREFKELMGFGLNITGMRFTQLVGDRMDYLFIGRFLSAEALGFYNLGLKVVQYPSLLAWTAVYRVTFPVFSSIQDEDDRLHRGFLKALAFLCLIALPFFTGLAIVAPELVTVVFGVKWQPAVLPLQILCISGVANAIVAVVQPPLLSKGRPDIVLKLSIVRLVLLPIFLFIGVKFGTYGASAAVSAAAVILVAANYVFVGRLLKLKMRDLVTSVGPSVLGTGVMTVVLMLLRHWGLSLGILHGFGLLVVSVCVGVVTYFVALKVIRSQTLDEMVGLLIKVVRR